MSTISSGKPSTSTNGKKAVIIGAGNVATHIAKAIAASGLAEIVQVASRTISSAAALAKSISTSVQAVADMADVRLDADLYIVSVSDSAIPGVLSALPPLPRSIIVHTSGSVGIEVFDAQRFPYHGVLYPLQTFSKAVPLDIAQVPVFIEGDSMSTEQVITELFTPLFRTIRHADSEHRRRLHIAAVFACNFVNYLLSLAHDQLATLGLDITALRPLIAETVRKALDSAPLSPFENQTGPAVRHDKNVTDAHLALLEGMPHDVYKMLTQAIIQTSTPSDNALP